MGVLRTAHSGVLVRVPPLSGAPGLLKNRGAIMWTPESYRDLARKCLARAEESEPPNSDFMRKMAVEYEAKARDLEDRNGNCGSVAQNRG